MQMGGTTGASALRVPIEAPDRQSEGDDKERCRNISNLNTANSILDLRRSLLELNSWKNPVFAEAHALSRAIEATLDSFAPFLENRFNGTDSYIWPMIVRTKYCGEAWQEVQIHLRKRAHGWSTRVDELCAALSLRFYSSGVNQDTGRTSMSPGPRAIHHGTHVRSIWNGGCRIA